MLHTEKAKLTSVLAMFGISSSAGLYRSISMSDIAAVCLVAVLLAIASGCRGQFIYQRNQEL
jgi:hypothetical protein